VLLNRRKPIILHHYFILVQYVYDVLSLCLFYIIDFTLCSKRLTTEENLATKIASVATRADEQRKAEESLNWEIQDQAKMM